MPIVEDQVEKNPDNLTKPGLCKAAVSHDRPSHVEVYFRCSMPYLYKKPRATIFTVVLS